LNYNKLEDILKEQKITIPQLAEQIGMTRGGLYTAIERKTLTVSKLELIAEVLKVDVITFFIDEKNVSDLGYTKENVLELKKEAQQILDSLKITNERLENKRRTVAWIYHAIKFNIESLAKEIDKENPSVKSKKLIESTENLLKLINESEHIESDD
jgi:transcriptional regulator with XRE-family HTH domain